MTTTTQQQRLDRPVDHRVLRQATLLLKEAFPRGRVPITIHAGVPTRTTFSYCVAAGPRLDQAWRRDIAGSLLQRTNQLRDRWAWLTRSGPLAMHDADAAWSAAWYAACGEAAVDVPFVVVTRHGWFDPRTGHVQEWTRLRRYTAGKDPLRTVLPLAR